MTAVAEAVTYTPEDLLTMPDGDRYELVHGELVERDMGFHSGHVGGELQFHLQTFVKQHRLGRVLPAQVGYQCFPDDPAKVRKPDVSFISYRRLSADQVPDGHCRVAPELAVDVVSPNDYFDDVLEKVDEYLQADVQLIWVLDPGTKFVHVYRADGTGIILRATDELSGDQVLPGFRCRVAVIFEPQGTQDA